MSERVRAKKSLGQNFLGDTNIQRRIVAAIEPHAADVVLEIGPGMGALTHHLIGAVKELIAIELDDALAERLQLELGKRADFRLVHANALEVDFAKLDLPADYKAIGNIPYNITTPLLFKLLERTHRPRLIVVMVQKEVALRITSEPGHKEFGALSVGVQSVARAERLFTVARGAFRPVPGVDSAIVRITPFHPPPLSADEEKDVRALTRATFAHRRKQLQKVLRTTPPYTLDPEQVAQLERVTGLQLDARPETLSAEQFIALARALRALGLPQKHRRMNLKELITVLGHELRTPLAAIMGYQELLRDGVYGELSPRTSEPLERIHSSALQLLNLIDGLQELAAPSAADDDEEVPATTDELVSGLVDAARPFAESRGVKIDTTNCPRLDLGTIRLQRLLRAGELATVAAVKSSSGRSLFVHCAVQAEQLQVRIEGSGLDPVNDSPTGVFSNSGDGQLLNAARLRLAMAAAALTPVGGSLELQSRPDGTAVVLHLPLAR